MRLGARKSQSVYLTVVVSRCRVSGVTDRNYKLDELARAAGMSARTVRYYVQRGLLPAPAFRGKDTAYRHEHLVRLRAIRRLQEAYYPLDAIAAELEGRTSSEIERMAEGHVRPPVLSAPSPPAPSTSPATRDEVARSIELFPGVELTVADDAPPESVRLVEQLLEILKATSKTLSKPEGGRRR
jgi:DNA-binding transcriptional MerR regulator